MVTSRAVRVRLLLNVGHTNQGIPEAVIELCQSRPLNWILYYVLGATHLRRVCSE